MAKADWGTKYTCAECGAKFYDMHKDTPACPACGTVVDLSAMVKPRRPAPAPKPKAPVKAPKPADTDDDEVALDDDDGDAVRAGGKDVDIADDSDEEDQEELIEDASELGEDEDDMAEVLEGTVEDKPQDV